MSTVAPAGTVRSQEPFVICINNEEEQITELVAQTLAPQLKSSDLLILSGELGAGKTLFSRALLHALGLPSEERVTSPTFTLVHEYNLPRLGNVHCLVLHADLYRLNSPGDVDQLGLLERREAGALLLVEWGRPFVSELGGDAIHIDFELDPRRLTVSGDSHRALELLATLKEASSLGPLTPYLVTNDAIQA